ncbi:hypothetical protein L2E81_10505 [Planktothrix agardhii 1033]|nr:hypothetical protein [Planktothrix agardhii 1033]
MYNQQNINQKSTETPTEEDALGIKNPLLTPTTLGQNFLSLQSISPLGSRSINLINWSLISPNQTLLQNFQDNENWQDSSISEFRPFSKNSLTENSPIIEPQSDKTLPSSVPIQLSSELPIQQPPETSFIDSESPIPQPPETPSFDSESPIGQTENIFPFQIDQKTRRNSVIQNSKSSTSHFFQKKSEFPREKISQENVNKLTKKSAENQDISTTEESVINSIETNDLQTINPTDIVNPEIPVSTLQKQPESVSVINPTDIVNPEIPVSTLQKQPESVSIINPTDISIEELLGESNSTPSKPTVVQAFFKKEGRQAKHSKHPHRGSDIRTGMLLPPGISSGVAGIHNLDSQQQPTSVKVLMEKTIQTRIQQEQKTASRKAEPVETLTRSNLGLEEHQLSSAIIAQKEETKQAETKTDQVEVLAREIYGLVRQRFEIERERQGSSYDRRLL